jgi:ankyrin repeat protein
LWKKRHINFEPKDNKDQAPLHKAAYYGELKIVEYLGAHLGLACLAKFVASRFP